MFAGILCTSFFAMGCESNLGVAREEFEPVFPSQYFLPASTSKVWPIVKSHSTNGAGGAILAMSDADHLVVWADPVRNASPQDQSRNGETEEIGAEGCSITTIYLWSVPGGSQIRIHRVFYGPATAPNLSYSRGIFEVAFYRRVCADLGINPEL
jgi:hypothetical protein